MWVKANQTLYANPTDAEVTLFLSDRFFKFLSRCQVHARLVLDLGPVN